MTALSQIPAGARLTALMLRSVAPLSAYKAANQSVTSSTTLVNDSVLFVPVLANAVYVFACALFYAGGTAGSSDLKFVWSAPSGASMSYSLTGQQASAGLTPTTGYVRGVAGAALGTNGTGNNYSALMFGSAAMGTAAGTLQLQWAQNTSNATATTIQSGSILALWQIQ